MGRAPPSWSEPPFYAPDRSGSALARRLRGAVTRFVTHGERGDCADLAERGADSLARQRGVGVPVELAHERAAIAVAELGGDDVVGELEHVQQVPGEVVAGGLV